MPVTSDPGEHRRGIPDVPSRSHGRRVAADYQNLTGGAGDDTHHGDSGNGYSTIAGGARQRQHRLAARRRRPGLLGAPPTAVMVELPWRHREPVRVSTLSVERSTTSSVRTHGDTLIGEDSVQLTSSPGAGNDTVTGATSAIDGRRATRTTCPTPRTPLRSTWARAHRRVGRARTRSSDIEDVSGTEARRRHHRELERQHRQLLDGDGGNDKLSGGPGDGDGADSFDGGAGIDKVDYGANTSATTVNLTAGGWIRVPGLLPERRHGDGSLLRDTRSRHRRQPIGKSGVGAEGDVLINIENAVLGTGNDTFTGSSFNNTVWPNGGQNVLNGCPAALAAGCGIDTVNYSTGVRGRRYGQPLWWWPVRWQRRLDRWVHQRGRHGLRRRHHRDRPQHRELVEGRQGQRQHLGQQRPGLRPRRCRERRHPWRWQAKTRLEGSGWQGQHQRLWWWRRHLRR